MPTSESLGLVQKTARRHLRLVCPQQVHVLHLALMCQQVSVPALCVSYKAVDTYVLTHGMLGGAAYAGLDLRSREDRESIVLLR